MKSETKKEVKKHATTGASTAAGAVAGAAAGIFFSNTASAEPMPEPIPEPEPKNQPPHSSTHHTSQTHHYQEPELIVTPEPGPQQPLTEVPVNEPMDEPVVVPFEEPSVTATPLSSGEVEVISYERVMAEDGSPMDVAVVSINGNEVNLVDVNIDGYADLMSHDSNHDGIIDNSEIQNVEGLNIDMQQFQEGAGFNPILSQEPYTGMEPSYSPDDVLAQNDLPDYVNDADVDSFMA